jgi:phosphoenolpyruvate synthase/pyruvate phosphate dikinase
VTIVGGKNACLGAIISAESSVPFGFIVAVLSYERYIIETTLSEKIYNRNSA